ncbi:MAG: histidine phosphatase family protein [Candidatus Thorarchaeota archaeon]
MVSDHEWTSIGWLGEARALLSWLHTLDSGPVLLMVRHSERLEDIDVPTTIQAELTSSGHDLACEFGRRLPVNMKTTIFHSPHIRTRQTAERIASGLKEKGGDLLAVEKLDVLLGGRGDIGEIVTLAYEIGFDDFYFRWKRNEIPPEIIEPIDDYLERLTQQVVDRFTRADANNLHVYVTHDMVIAASRSIYLDISVDRGLSVPFLGGFSIAKTNDRLVGFNSGDIVSISKDFLLLQDE